MCPYKEDCKIQKQYAGTDLCQDRYAGCAGYMYAGLKGAAAVPENMPWIMLCCRRNSAGKYRRLEKRRVEKNTCLV
ncbi:MAG: hypothetical protein ACRDBM_03940 [Sporomusa sp.]